MLYHNIPVRVVSVVVIVRNCKFYPPIILVVVLNMPMNLNWAHVISALHCVEIFNNH